MKTQRKIANPILSIAVACAALVGCDSKPTQPLATVDFYAPQRHDTDILRPPAVQAVPATRPAQQASTQSASPATAPAARLASLEYMTLGGVVADVNGKPIYAHKVLAAIKSALAANARRMDEESYRLAAEDLIKNQIKDFAVDEQWVATAQRGLDDKDKTIADRLTMKWRQEQVTQAGGSLELARRRTAADGQDFEELVQEHYRKNLAELYRYRKIVPRIDITAIEMHEYYDRNLDRDFTEHGKARFSLIKINPEDFPSREAAINRITMLRSRAVAGNEDFAKLARENNKDARLAAAGGEVGWIDRNAYILEKVEKEIWQTPPGQVTDIVEDSGGLYIAKVEEKKEGKVWGFEEQRTQDKIYDVLFSSQLHFLQNKEMGKFVADFEANFQDNPEMREAALEMAMQMYHRLRPQRAAASTTEPAAQ